MTGRVRYWKWGPFTTLVQREPNAVKKMYYTQYFKTPVEVVLGFYFALSDLKDYGKVAALLLYDKLSNHETLESIVETHFELTSRLYIKLNVYKLLHSGRSIDENRMIFQSMEKRRRGCFPRQTNSKGFSLLGEITVGIIKQFMPWRKVIPYLLEAEDMFAVSDACRRVDWRMWCYAPSEWKSKTVKIGANCRKISR